MKIIDILYDTFWGVPAILLILSVGILLTIRTHCLPLRLLPAAQKQLFDKKTNLEKGSSFRALCTALAATVGTGNLVGVAGAICLGGPGAVFWMLVCGFFGMSIKYAEAVLAVRYQTEDCGETVGGMMYIICNGLGTRWRPMAYCYCIFGIAANFGIGNLVQVNSIVTSLGKISRNTAAAPMLLGLLLSLLIAAAFLHGAESIGKISEWLVPSAAGLYVVLCCLFLAIRAEKIPAAIHSIFLGAFSPRAATGGMIGALIQTIRTGCSRGVFSNEAGMGTASIAHGSACVLHPVQQGMMGVMEVFLDTFVVCTLTALVILCSGISIDYGIDSGAKLTTEAFSAVYGSFGSIIVAGILSLFAFATILGWSLYGLRCTEFLMGRKAAPVFFFLQTVTVLFGSVARTPFVWRLSELFNGMMLTPSLIAVLLLLPETVRLTKEYQSLQRNGSV